MGPERVPLRAARRQRRLARSATNHARCSAVHSPTPVDQGCPVLPGMLSLSAAPSIAAPAPTLQRTPHTPAPPQRGLAQARAHLLREGLHSLGYEPDHHLLEQQPAEPVVEAGANGRDDPCGARRRRQGRSLTALLGGRPNRTRVMPSASAAATLLPRTISPPSRRTSPPAKRGAGSPTKSRATGNEYMLPARMLMPTDPGIIKACSQRAGAAKEEVRQAAGGTAPAPRAQHSAAHSAQRPRSSSVGSSSVAAPPNMKGRAVPTPPS